MSNYLALELVKTRNSNAEIQALITEAKITAIIANS
jgi:hypothetical protein